MRRRGLSTLSLCSLTAAWLTSCALKPIETPSPAARASDCAAPDPLHVVSASKPKHEVDPEIESLLAQRTRDARLIQINRQMYQSLHALDAELRSEQTIESCKQRSLDSSTLEAQSTTGATSASKPGFAPSPASATSIADSVPSATSRASSAPNPVAPVSLPAANALASGAQASSVRKTSVPANGAGGNGATAPKIVPGSDNDIVARRLRKAAEQEKDPTLRAKLWKEYMDYQRGTAAAK